MQIIEVKDLIKKYKKSTVNAVDGVSFDVEEGTFFSLLGPNGAGKTTTLSILNTTLSKTSGEIKIAGFDIEKDSSDVRQKIGVIFQNPSLDLNLTAEENIRFHANLYGLYQYRPLVKMMPTAYRKKLEELAHVLDLKTDELNKPVKTFSGGMKRKLEIIRGLMHDPRVLFLDEPTQGLDPLSRKNLWEYLQKIRKEKGITVFLTTHYLEEAEGSDYVCIIKNGQIVSKGTPSHIKKHLADDYLVVDSKDADRYELKNQLDDMNVKYEGEGPFKIDINGHGSAQKIIQGIKIPLTTLKLNNPTLEEAYIQIIERKNDE